MKIQTKLEKKAVKYGDATFYLRPFPYDQLQFERGNTNPVESEKTMFMFCVESWEGVEDLDTGEKFECNEENKLYLFRYEYALRISLVSEINELMKGRMERLKNSLRSQAGKEIELDSNATTATDSMSEEKSNPPATNANGQE